MTQEGEIVCGWRFVGLQRFFQQGALWGRTASLACLFQHQQLGVAVSPRTFGWHGWVVAGRQAGSVSRQRTRSDQPVITTVSTLPWSLRPKKNNKSTALTIFHREWNFNVFKQRRHAAGGYNPADISDTEDQKVATTTRKPQRRSSRCFLFFFHARRERRHPAWEEAPRSGTPVGATLIVSGESPQHFRCSLCEFTATETRL